MHSPRSSRSFGTAALLLVGLACMAFRGTAAETTAATERFVVRGLADPDPVLLARSLAADEELLLLSSPLTTRKTLLAAVASKTMMALQHLGCATPQAVATVEPGHPGERIMIDVVPGTRQLAAGIEIAGLDEGLTEDLRRWLRSSLPAPGAVPQSFDTEGGWSGTRWLDSRGQPARMEPPVWSRGHPAPFDAPHLATVRAAIARFLREHGFFAAAKLAEKPAPSLWQGGRDPAGGTIDVAVRPSDDGGVLTITFANLPPASTLREIEVAPAGRAPAAVLQDKLGIVPGGPVTERDRAAWQEALRQSGRFVRHEVKFREVKPIDGGPPGIVAIFDLAAYPHVPPLAEPLTREQEVLLRTRKWLLDTLANDDDLVVAWTRPATAQAAAVGPQQPTGSLVISTREGLLLAALPASADACGMAVSGAGLGWFLPAAAGWFELPLPVRTRLDIDVSLDLHETVDKGRHDYRRELHAACHLEPRPRDATAAVALAARIEPVACLSLLAEGNPAIHWEGEQLVVAGDEVAARIDGPTGRILSLTLADGGSISFDAAPGRFAHDLAALRAAAGHDLTRPDALVSSGVLFFTSDAMRAAARHLLDAVDLSQVMSTWQERLDAIAAKLQRTADSGGFAAADRAADAALDQLAATAATPLVLIPATTPSPADASSGMVMARLAATHAWRWMDHTCGRDTWPAALARMATLATRHDAGVIWELSAYLASKQHGPVAYLAASSAAPTPSMAASLARQGQERLTAEAFHADCLALLAALKGCGLDGCGVSLLRTIDDTEAEEIGAAWLRDRESLVPLVRDLRTCESDAAAVAALPDALDRWCASLQKVVATALAARAEIQTADKPPSDPTAIR